eukprot:292077-Rhodomonas_salina.4
MLRVATDHVTFQSASCSAVWHGACPAGEIKTITATPRNPRCEGLRRQGVESSPLCPPPPPPGPMRSGRLSERSLAKAASQRKTLRQTRVSHSVRVGRYTRSHRSVPDMYVSSRLCQRELVRSTLCQSRTLRSERPAREIKLKTGNSRYKAYSSCGFLCLISGVAGANLEQHDHILLRMHINLVARSARSVPDISKRVGSPIASHTTSVPCITGGCVGI